MATHDNSKKIEKAKSKDVKDMTPDYSKLPFEVIYEHVGMTTFEIVIDEEAFEKDKQRGYSGTLDEWIKRQKGENCALEIGYWRLFNTTFRCDNIKTGLELFVILGRNCRNAPDWLSLHGSDSDRDNDRLDYSERHAFYIENNCLQYEESDEEAWGDTELDDYEHAGPSEQSFNLEDSLPIIILDADGSRLKIDHQGHQIDDHHNRIGKKLLSPLSKTRLQKHLLELTNEDNAYLLGTTDATEKLGKWFTN
jgi:hypothetical protein